MIQDFAKMNDPLYHALRTFFLWQKGYPGIINLWLSKSNLKGFSEDFNHWLVIVNLSSDRSLASWWKFVDLRSKKESFQLEEWAGAFAYQVIPGPPPTF